MDLVTAKLEEGGYAVIPDVVGFDDISRIERFIDGDGNGMAGTRRLIDRPWCRELADRLTRDTRLSGALPARACSCKLLIQQIGSGGGLLRWKSLKTKDIRIR